MARNIKRKLWAEKVAFLKFMAKNLQNLQPFCMTFVSRRFITFFSSLKLSILALNIFSHIFQGFCGSLNHENKGMEGGKVPMRHMSSCFEKLPWKFCERASLPLLYHHYFRMLHILFNALYLNITAVVLYSIRAHCLTHREILIFHLYEFIHYATSRK